MKVICDNCGSEIAMKDAIVDEEARNVGFAQGATTVREYFCSKECYDKHQEFQIWLTVAALALVGGFIWWMLR